MAATGTAVFALRRPTWSAPEAQSPADMPPVDALVPAESDGRPAWVRCYEMRFAEGGLPVPFDGLEQPHSNTRLWVRDAPPRRLDFAALAALCDCFFPRIFIRRRRPAPIGTVSLTCVFHADADQLAAQGDRPLLGTARALNFRNGYFDQAAELWSDDGRMLASSHQLVYYRE